MGFRVTHLYGLTEDLRPGDALRLAGGVGRAAAGRARQADGAPGRALSDARAGLMVADPETLAPVPRDGETMGEIMLRGNTVMKGYLKNPSGHGRGVRGRLVPHRRSRGLASRRLRRDQGPLEGHHHLRRREHLVPRGRGRALSPSGGDGGGRRGAAGREMGRDAVRLRRAEAGRDGDRRRTSSSCAGEHMAHFKAPQHVVFGPLPKTSTGKIQKYVLRERARSTRTQSSDAHGPARCKTRRSMP